MTAQTREEIVGITYTGWHFTAGQHHGRDGWPLQKVERVLAGGGDATPFSPEGRDAKLAEMEEGE